MPSLRPSEFKQQARNGQTDESEPFLEIVLDTKFSVDVFFCQRDIANAQEIKRAKVLNVQPETLTIWPLNVRPDKADYLMPKYDAIERIVLSRHVRRPYQLPESEDDVVELLDGLPEGFSKQFQFGLGLHWENRFICEAIASIPGISILCIHGGNGDQDAVIDTPFYILGLRRFHEIRKELARIAARHQRVARTDKDVFTYQKLLHAADADRFPRKISKIKPDAIADMTNVGGARASLSKRDQRAAVRLVNENAEDLAKAEPQALMSLKTDIERVTLKELISKMEDMLTKSLMEARWQSFFLMNPFVLSLAFSVPTMMVQGNPYVGGKRFNGRGGKISDFLLATATTGNLAIVEIKKPSTELLTKTPYRDDVYGLSPELNGTLIQVLDQRYKLQKTLPLLKDESGMHDIHAYAVKCIIIAGTTPATVHERKSLEFARHAFADVMLVTFNELLNRLKHMYEVLAPNTGSQQDQDDLPF